MLCEMTQHLVLRLLVIAGPALCAFGAVAWLQGSRLAAFVAKPAPACCLALESPGTIHVPATGPIHLRVTSRALAITETRGTARGGEQVKVDLLRLWDAHLLAPG